MTGRSERKVLLALRGGRPDKRVLCCARNIALRVDAGIEILLIASDGRTHEMLQAFLAQLQQDEIDCRLIHRNGNPVQEIVRYASDHKGVLCVVIDSLEGWSDGVHDGDKVKDPWKRLECPLVVATACDPKS